MTQPLTKEASDLAVPPLKQVEPAGRGGVLTERAWQEKVDDSWQCDWWRGETTFQSGFMTRVSPLFSGQDKNNKYADKADAFCKYIVFPKGLNWPAHACKAPLEYERVFENKKRKEGNRHEILNVHEFRILASWYKSEDNGMENIYSRVS